MTLFSPPNPWRGFGRAVLAVAALLAPACAAAPPPPRPAPARRAPAAAAEPDVAPLGPARWVLTQRAGVVLDEAEAGAPPPRSEPVLYEGLRLRLAGGAIAEAARAPDFLVGFRSIPARLGGGFVLWSDTRVYRAADFMGALRPVVDAGARGARPWLGAILLRSDRGFLELDPASLAVRRVAAPGLADAIALDARRAARVDALGRAEVTLDGGATWTDVLAARGLVTTQLTAAAGHLDLAGPSGPAARLGPAGLVDLPRDPALARRFAPENALALEAPPSGPPPVGYGRLASEHLAAGLAAGALLAGGRILAQRPDGFVVLAAATGQPIDDAEPLNLDRALARCQPARAGADVLLACAHEGAHVLRLDATLAAPKLEATFPPPERGARRSPAGFVAGPRGRLAWAGRCGRTPPSADDFQRAPPPAPEPAPEPVPLPPRGHMPRFTPPPAPPPEPEPPEPEPKPEHDDARVCLRAQPGAPWIERRLRGDDARRLYRWIPGDSGDVTALVLVAPDPPGDASSTLGAPGRLTAPSAPNPPALPAEPGVRVVRVRLDDPALSRGVFPAPSAPGQSPRLVDDDFWLDDDGAVRGWIHLPEPGADGEAAEAPPALPPRLGGSGEPEAPFPVSTRRGGRVAGVRIDAAGRATVFPLPEGVAHVVHGGRFALARTGDEDGPAKVRYFESTDGGRSFRPVEGPPVGRLDPPFDESAPWGCSASGCTLGDQGLVRLGWGGPAPAPRAEPGGDDGDDDGDDGEDVPDVEPAANPALPAPAPPLVTCRLDGDPDAWPPAPPPPAAAPPAPPITLRTPRSAMGQMEKGTWTADVVPPFAPAAGARRLSVRDAAVTPSGSVAVLLRAPSRPAPADLLLMLGPRRLVAGDAPATFPFDPQAAIASAAELPGGDLVALDPGRMTFVLAGRAAARPVARLGRVDDPARARITLAQLLDGRGVAVAGYSTSSGDVFAGALDLARAEVGPLEALGSLSRLGEAGAGRCKAGRRTHRFAAELPIVLRIVTKGGKTLLEDRAQAVALLAAGGGEVCVEGLEVQVRARAEAVDVSATFGPKAAAVARHRGRNAEKVRCEVEEGKGRG